jgi:transcriptional regulator
MYIPEHFRIKSEQALHKIIQTHPLGALVMMTPNGLDANHIPFEFDPVKNLLTGHVARANPVWQQCGSEESYISPNWYPSKHEFHRQVPTWNYQVVHVHGRMVVQDTEKFVRGVVGRLTRKHEATEAKPWKMGDSTPDYIDGMLKAIVGIEITITRMEGKAKLSQNREDRDRLNASDVLARQGDLELANAMRNAKPIQQP